MTITELLENEPLRQYEFPVARDRVFLGHAGVCPLPRRVADVVKDYANSCTLGDQETLLPAYQMQRTRELAARLLHAAPDEIALVGPTSLGLSFVAGGLALDPGDNVLVYLDDYPSNVYPWMAMAQRGIELRFLKTAALGQIREQDILEQVDHRTRLVALASCHFIAGYRIDIAAIGRSLSQRGILFCVDAIQTVGAFPTLVEHVDFLAADAHKWMLGPCGAGIFYVRKSLQDRLRPAVYGWHNVRCPNFVTQEQMVLRPDARRYEAGTHNLLGVVGLHAALELILEIGIENIASELLRKRALLIGGLQAKGYTVLQSSAPAEHASGIVACYRPHSDMAIPFQQLEQAGVIASLRTDRSGQRYLRFSPHFYNTDAELERALALL